MKYKLTNLNEKESMLNLDYIIISREDAHIILNCVKNAIRVYEDDSENDLLGMDESDLEICKEFINCFKSIYKTIEEFIIKDNNASLNFKIETNEIEALQNAFELYCMDMDKDITDKNHHKALKLYDEIKEINWNLLNKTNPKFIKMLNNFKNTSLK